MAYAEQAETEALHEPKSFLTKYIWSQDHKVIAIQYSLTAIFVGLIALVLSCLLYTSDAADDTSVKVDEGYIKESVLHPNAKIVKGYAAVMPALAPSDEELNTLIAFIKSKANADADASKAEPGK